MDAGNYTILSRLGEGPRGAIYEGAHKQTQERVVVRILPPALSKEPNVLGRLLALQRALGRLEPERSIIMPVRTSPGAGDPSVAGILECGRLPDGSLFVVSEFVTGESLATQLKRHAGLPLPNKALRLGRQLSATLVVAHAANIHHLALRPDKILLAHVPGTTDTEHLKILDLGLFTSLGRIPRPDDLPKTALPYLAPEYFREETGAGGQADVYALGVILYEMGSGGLPPQARQPEKLRGESLSSTGSLAGADAQTALLRMLPSWLQPFGELLDRMMFSAPFERPSMAQVAASLQQLTAMAPNPSGTSLPQSAATPKLPLIQIPSQSAKSLRETIPLFGEITAVNAKSPLLSNSAVTPRANGDAKDADPPSEATAVNPVRTFSPPPIAPSAAAPTAQPKPVVAEGHDTDEVSALSVEAIASAQTPPSQLSPGAKVSEAAPSAVAAQTSPPAESSAAATPAPATQNQNSILEMDVVAAEELTLSTEATHMVSTAPADAASKIPPPGAAQNPPAKAAADEEALEIEAEYTINPKRESDHLLPFSSTQSAGEGGAEAGTGGGRTAATPVEPGLSGTTVLKVGQLVGNFRIVSKIGQGGMGAVYAAVHRQIGRRAAIKVLHGPLARTADYTARFLNEARAVNILRHSNLVEIFDFGQLSDGTLYIIMEFLEGESLRAKLRRLHKLGEHATTDMALQMAQALDAAHQKGIVHRDLKPENVMLVADPARSNGERVKILDFGIAKVTQQNLPNVPSDPDSQEFQTAIGTTMGTPKYMAPEQYGDARKVDGKADVFALGVILYEMVSGQAPFPKTSLSAFHQAPIPLSEAAPDVSNRLIALVHRMLTPKPAERPTMREVLEQLVAPPPSPVVIPPPPPPAPPPVVPSSGYWGWVILGIFLVFAVAIGMFAYRGGLRPPPPEVPLAQDEADLLIDTAGPKARALGVLYQGIKSSDPRLRAQAAQALGQSRDVAQWSSIASLLKDSDPGVQAEAAEALGKLGASDAHGDLLVALESNLVPGVRVAVAGALARLVHPRGSQALKAMLNDPDERVRLRAAQILLETGDMSAAESLRAAVQKGNLPDDTVVRILGRLAQSGDDAAKRQLSARLTGESFGLRSISAAGQLARLGDERARALLTQGAQKPGPQQLFSALLLAIVGDTFGYSLFKSTAVDTRQPVEARQISMDGLGACGRRQGAVLLAGVLDETTTRPVLRQMAASAILQITGGDPSQIAKQSLSWAQAALGHDDWPVRQAATAVLADLDNDQSVPLLARALKDTQREVRRSAAVALGQKSVRSALYALRAALDDAEPEVRKAGLSAMGNLLGTLGAAGSRVTDAQTRQRLQELVETGSPEEQLMASATLLRLGDSAQLERLRTGLASSDPLLRKLVVESVTGDDGLPLLKMALADTDSAVRFDAARRLAALSSREAVPVLRQVLAQGGADGLIAYSLLKKLGEAAELPAGYAALLGRDTPTSLALLDAVSDLPLRDALPILNQARFDAVPAVRKHVGEIAASMYRKAADSQLLAVIYSLLNDSDIDVRTRVGTLLGKLMRPSTALAVPVVPSEEPPPDLGAPPADLSASPPDLVVVNSRGVVRIVGEPRVRFQFDGQGTQLLGAGPAVLTVDSGRHVVSFAGGSIEVRVEPGGSVTTQVPLAYSEQLLGDAGDAIGRRDLDQAQQLVNHARTLFERTRSPRTLSGELLLLQARIFELRGNWGEAMKNVQALLALPEAQRKAEHMASARALSNRLASKLGRIRVSKEVEGRCLSTEQWVRPGEHVIDQGGGTPKVVHVREGATADLNLCGKGAP